MNLLNTGVDSAKHDIQELVEGLQAERSEALAGLRKLQLATRLLAQAEALRLARRNPADPRLAPLAVLDKTTRERVAVLDVEIEVASIRVPPVRKTETLLHGRVTDDARRAVARLSLVLVGEDGRPVAGVAPVESDAAGYYAFLISPEAAATIGSTARLSVAVQHGDTEVRPKDAAGFTLASGGVAVKDLALDEDALERLKLRSVARPGADPAKTGSGGTAPVAVKRTVKRNRKPRPG